MNTDKPYSNRELREKWHDTANTLQSILIQVTNTNGRVDKLELAKAKQDGFYKALGIFGVIGWSIAMSLIGWMLLQIVNLDNKIQIAVDKSLSAYEINE